MSLNPLLDTQNGREPTLLPHESLLHVSAQAEFVIESGGYAPNTFSIHRKRANQSSPDPEWNNLNRSFVR
eukprot:6280995-Pyramimonas_sp.AAC.1